MRKENTVVLNKLEKALLASQQVGEKHAKTTKERDEFAAQLAEAQKALEEKERAVVDKDSELREKEKAIEEKERALEELRKVPYPFPLNYRNLRGRNQFYQLVKNCFLRAHLASDLPYRKSKKSAQSLEQIRRIERIFPTQIKSRLSRHKRFVLLVGVRE